MLKIAIIIGSTRPQRKGAGVGRWVHRLAQQRGDATYELLDVAAFDLPLLDEPAPPMMHEYSQPHTHRWAAAVAPCDAYVFVTAEYNHGIPGALKNAIDFLYQEWNDKAAGFVSYGSLQGARAVEQLRLVMGELRIADIREQVGLSLFDDFDDDDNVKSNPRLEKQVHKMLDQLAAWAGAMQTLRSGQPATKG
jgi:NAD(P)H-dependent FMN reductase